MLSMPWIELSLNGFKREWFYFASDAALPTPRLGFQIKGQREGPTLASDHNGDNG